FEHLDVQAASAGPDLLGYRSQGCDIGSEQFGPSFSVLRRETPNCRLYNLTREGVAELLPAGGNERDQNAPFDLAPLQMADRHIVRHGSPRNRVFRAWQVCRLIAVALAPSKPSGGGRLDQYFRSTSPDIGVRFWREPRSDLCPSPFIISPCAQSMP